MPVVSPENVVDLVVSEITAIADLCRGVDPAAPVPTCPDWALADLLEHVGTVHRWAATMVERSSQERLKREDMDWSPPEDKAELPDWVAAGAEFVATRFRAADPSTPMWAWGWPKTAGFWPRRMVHETGVHRADAAIAVGKAPTFDPEIAADGVDELLDNLPHAAYFAPKVAELKGDGEVLALVATDLGEGWEISLQPDGFVWARVAEPSGADAVLAASAADVLLTLYGRRALEPDDLTGDRTLVERWIASSAL